MTAIAVAVLLGWCSMLTIIDIAQQRLPNPLTATGALLAFGYAALTGQFNAAMIGAALLALPYLLVHLALPASFGAGDVKLAVGLGAVTAMSGAQAWVWAAIAAPVFTALAGVIPLTTRHVRKQRTQPPVTIAHGPAMCLATVLAVLIIV